MSHGYPLYELIRKNSDPNKKYLHVVGFKFRDTVPHEDQAALMRECEELRIQCGGNEAGICTLVTKTNIDTRKGFTWVEIGVYANPEAFISFHAHPVHKAFSEKIAKAADVWVVLDVSMDFEI